MKGQVLGLGVTVLAGGPVLRRRYLRWGATDEEVQAGLPGDETLPDADLVATRAITIHAAPMDVWPWLTQMGQGRGGLYSYDWLENLIGCDIHSADRIMPKWQHIKVGDASASRRPLRWASRGWIPDGPWSCAAGSR